MSSGILRPLIFVAATAFLFAGSAVRVSAADAWLKIESTNFELIGDASEADIRSVGARLERFRIAANKLFGLAESPEPTKIRVVVFKDAASFSPFKPKLADGTHDDLAAGYFQSGEDVSYIAVSATTAGLGTIYHEYTHFILNRHFGNAEIPPWLNEGLAEYLETFRQIDEKRVEIGSLHQKNLATLRTTGLMPWDRFFKLDNVTLQQTTKQARMTFYAQAWAVLYFLNSRETKPDSFRGLFQSLSKSASSIGEITRLAGLDVAAIDAGARTLISQKSEAFPIIGFEADAAAVAGVAVSLDTARSDAYLGDLLYHLRDGSAETYLARSLAAEPALGMANATLSLVRLRQRRFTDAKRLLEKAMAADENNHLVHFYYAYLISREYMDEFGGIDQIPTEAAKTMRMSLEKAISLNARFAESHKLLALVGLITGDNLNKALSAALRAQDLQPGNAEYSVIAARIYLGLERISEARTLAEKILRTGDDKSRKKEAQEIVRICDEIAAAKSARKQVTVNFGSGMPQDPVILKWRDLTPEQIAKIDDDREMNNLNILLDRAMPGEHIAVGSIERISCADGRINYRVKTDAGPLRLTTRNFSDLKVRVLTPGTRSFAFRCDTQFASEKSVLRFRPARQRPDVGTLISVAFVPSHFRLKSLDDIAKEPFFIIEGRPASDLEANIRSVAAERAEMERVLREQQLLDIQDRLREPLDNERRVIGVPEKVECTDGKYVIAARVENAVMIFETPIINKPLVSSFTPDTGIFELGCRSDLPPVSAVFTYRDSEPKTEKRNVIAIEFVPKTFRLQ
jgi:tetratricopeptide (TPR) repeat protein